jgi:flagellar capping protein FliD
VTGSDIDRELDVDDADDHSDVVAHPDRDGAGAQSIGGLATGLDANAIIAALVAAERALENPIKNQGSFDQLALQSYGLIRTDLSELTTAGLALARPAAWNTLAATSSNADIAAVTAGTARSAEPSRSPSTRSRAQAVSVRRTSSRTPRP